MKLKTKCFARVFLIALALPVSMAVRGDTLYVSGFATNRLFWVSSAGVVNPWVTINIYPEGLAIDKRGYVYVANFGANLINRVSPQGGISVFATNITAPYGVAFDSKTNLYVASQSSPVGTIKKITPQGTVTNFATISRPWGLAVDAADNLYVSTDAGGIYKVTPEGAVSSFSYLGARGLAVAKDGDLYAAGGAGTIYKLTPAGQSSVFTSVSGNVAGLAFDNAGNLYASVYLSDTVYKIAPNQTVTTFAIIPRGPLFLAVNPAPKFDPGRINLSRVGDEVVISWFGNFILQSATDATGPYTDIVGAASPYTNAISNAENSFFRLRN